MRLAKQLVLVLKSGGDFTPKHVEWLARQIPAGVQINVLTDYPEDDFNLCIKVIPLKYNWPGWWSKMEMFRRDLFDGPFLYMDLDTVVKSLPEEYFSYPHNLMLQDFYKPERAASGLMLLHPKTLEQLWLEWLANPQYNMNECGTFGDQAFIGPRLVRNLWQPSFPNEIISYKAQVLKVRQAPQSYAGDLTTANIICFHGKPRPWDVKDQPWIPTLT